MFTIGFANKYFTIWDVSVIETEHTSYTELVFIKNLSIDKEKAFKKALNEYNTNIFDADLRGKTRRVYTNTKSVPTGDGKNSYGFDKIHFGKYKNALIVDVTDIDYLKWYYNTDDVNGTRKLNVAKQIKSYDSEWLSLDERINERKILEDKLCDLSKNGFVDITMTTNISRHWEFTSKEYGRIELINSKIELKLMSYNGYDYFMFAKDGKGKRLKNKVIKVKFGRNKHNNFGVIEVLLK